MKDIYWLWTKFWDLTWWQMILWVAYVLYFLFRTREFWSETSEHGLIEGYKNIIFGYSDCIRMYHIVLMVFDIPPALLGIFFPFLRKVLRLKLYTFKKPEDNKSDNTNMTKTGK